MLRCQAHKRCTVNGILPGGKNRDLLIGIFNRKPDLGTNALSDPVSLHGNHLVRPPGKLITIRQQVFGIIGNPEKPLGQLLLTDLEPAPPAEAGLHLFVCKYGLTRIAPVDKGFFPVNHASLIHFQKEPLFPTVVVRMTGGDFPIPVIAEPDAL